MTPFYVVQIALPVPLRRLFDYLPNPNISDKSLYQPGCRVALKFGNRQMIGIVIRTSDNTDVPRDKLKPLEQLLDSTPILEEEQLKLCQWLARYYHHPLGEVLDLALPVLLRKGEPLNSIETPCWKPDIAAPAEPPKGSKRQELWQWLQQYPNGIAHQQVTAAGFSKAQITALQDYGYVKAFQQLEPLHTNQQPQAPLQLNNEQAVAVSGIAEHLNHFYCALLEGITGSGKTEVYLQLIEKALLQGKQVLVLVPEIGLTPQTIRRFHARLNTTITLLHSGLNDKERLIAWRQAKEGKARLLIGTRSAIFTPMPDLGMVIIDEEHDASFKQQDNLRYSARDFAIRRAQQKNIPIILGSATPCLETLSNALHKKFGHFKLQKRAGNAKPPAIKLHGMLHQPLESGLAIPVIQRIQHHLDLKQQVLIFINRRGYAPSLMCSDCGWVAECSSCDAAMTLHQYPAHLHCHHCDHQQAIPPMCPKCHSKKMEPLGQGTERLEDNLKHLFSTTDIKRIDRDTVRHKQAFDQLLDDIHKGEPCILVGTQMLAKGHHFPNVTLVVIVDADSGLFSADFRAMERSAQLIDQVTGRAGRAEKSGEVWIQTYFPDHPQLNLLIQSGYSELANTLLKERKDIQLPPYSFMALLRTESQDKQLAEQYQQQAREFIQRWLQQFPQQAAINLVGPFPAPMERRAGRFRQQLQLISDERTSLHNILEALAHYLEANVPAKVKWNLDIDPLDMM